MHLRSKKIILTNLNPKSILIKKISDKMILKVLIFNYFRFPISLVAYSAKIDKFTLLQMWHLI